MQTLRERLFLINMRIERYEEELAHMKRIRENLLRQIEESERGKAHLLNSHESGRDLACTCQLGPKDGQEIEEGAEADLKIASTDAEALMLMQGHRRCKACEV